MLLVLVFLLLLTFFLFILLKHSNNSNSNRLPPGPPGLPFIGNLHMLLFDNSVPHIFLWKLSRKYGPLMYLRFGFKSTLYRPIREDEVGRLIGKIFKLAVDSKPVNLSEVMMWFSSTIICRVGFGKRYDEGGIERSRFNLPKAVIKETFRLQPTAPLLVPQETLGKCNIGGYNVPAKTLVFVNAWAIGKDLETWENPEEFSPERIIGCSIDYKGLHFELVPFGAGRRICPGMRMRVATVDLALANLLYNFDWEMPIGMKKDDLDFEALPGITAHKKNALILIAKKNIRD
ncbi:cytochrome P450 71A1-like [Gossypium australe]|uniref:Cytochrome P450 71A1-like n=1 Tax=Gossypium australe TaxID=47621 RepID=A0A5B6X414_9ROSI|nr:cytochrome P450 71A1-like [Gossypium australe]